MAVSVLYLSAVGYEKREVAPAELIRRLIYHERLAGARCSLQNGRVRPPTRLQQGCGADRGLAVCPSAYVGVGPSLTVSIITSV